MNKSKTLFIIFIVLISSSLFFFGNDALEFYNNFVLRRLPQVEKEVTGFLIREIERQISTPPPLRAEKEAPEAFLTNPGVIYWTNVQRKENGLAPLLENNKLNQSAKNKLQDMFENQYFSHYSSEGEGVGDLAKTAEYEFIFIGENLALGNFKDDEELVQAWMNSQGHRENILNEHYQEIGVAVAKGLFEGKYTWIAVQHFALPLSVCFNPDSELKVEIESRQAQIESIYRELNSLLSEIKTIRPKRGTIYDRKVEEYNKLVEEYNDLIKSTQNLINEYNSQVRLFNDCLAGFE